MPFFWFLITLVLLVLLQRWIHRHLHGIALLLTGQADMALVLYALPLLPGVALHEISHTLMAVLLRVRSANLSIIPSRQADGRVRLGSVQVERFMTPERYSHVTHLVSEVVGELRDGVTPFELLRACFPAGTVSGAPKVRAMQLIAELEDILANPARVLAIIKDELVDVKKRYAGERKTRVQEDASRELTDEDLIADEDVVMCPDIFSTGLSGAERGGVRVGDTVAVFAQGPIGLCATLGAKLMGASLIVAIAPMHDRREIAYRFGASLAIAPAAVDPLAEIKRLTGGRALACSLLPGASKDLASLAARYGEDVIEQAVTALLSAKIHGRKPA